MDAYFKDNSLDSGRIWPENKGTVTPLYLARRNQYFLDKFAWYEVLRPQAPGDIFIIPEAMVGLINAAPPVVQRKREPRKKPEEIQLEEEAIKEESPDGIMELPTPIDTPPDSTEEKEEPETESQDETQTQKQIQSQTQTRLETPPVQS